MQKILFKNIISFLIFNYVCNNIDTLSDSAFIICIPAIKLDEQAIMLGIPAITTGILPS